MRSRVIPGSSPTIDRRDPVSRLNSVDLPTFGRPQIAISGSCPRLRALGHGRPSARQSASASRQSSSPMFSRPATLDERGVCRPTIPSAGRVALRGPQRLLGLKLRRPLRHQLGLRRSCLLGRQHLALARVDGSGRRSDFGARPFLGRVLACLCFLPNRFLSSLCATVNVQLSPRTR